MSASLLTKRCSMSSTRRRRVIRNRSERLEFDYKEKNVCQLCLHASKSDRKLGSLLGRSYHPECANLWFSRIDKMIPVFVSKEDSLFM